MTSLQAAIIKLPFDFRTGIMRASVNPADGQVYATGLQGWNGGGRSDCSTAACSVFVIRASQASWSSIARSSTTDFTFVQHSSRSRRIDRLASYSVEHWNYHWRREYGSDRYSPTTDQVGIDQLKVESVSLGADGQSVKLTIPELIPVDQLHLILRVKSDPGTPLDEEIYWTIHRVPAVALTESKAQRGGTVRVISHELHG